MRIRSLLKVKYGPVSAVPSFLSEEPVPIGFLYTGCQCEITHNDGDKTSTPSDKLLAAEFYTTGKRALILGNPGHGKTSFFKSLVHQWIGQKEENFILLFIPLKGLTNEMKLSAIVKNSFLKTENDITVEDIEDIVANCKCVVLLDGLNEMSFESNEGTSIDEDSQLLGTKTPTDKRSEKQFTIADCLSGEINTYCSDVCVWVTSQKDHENMFPYYNTLIRLYSFSKSQVKEYIKKCCSVCNSVKETNDCDSPNEKNIEIDDDENDDDTLVKITLKAANTTTSKSKHDEKETIELESQNESNKEINRHVYEILEKRDIIDDFIKAPHLLLLMIQILTVKFTSKTNRQDQQGDLHDINTATLTGCLVTCMEKMYINGSEKGLCSSESTVLKNKLEELAIQTAFNDSFSIESFQSDAHEYISIALAIGYLQIQEPCTTTTSSTTKIGFCHPYIHDYFTICNIIQNPLNLERVIEMLKRNKMSRRLTFCKLCSFLEKPVLEQLCDLLIKSKMLNHVIYCLFENFDNEDAERIVARVSDHQINLPHQEGNYHQEAVKAFCKRCVELKKTVQSIVFTGDWPFSFFETVNLPGLKRLEFYKMAFTENNFVSCLLQVKEGNMTNTLRFIECVLPDDLSEQSKTAVKKLKGSKLKVSHILELTKDIKPSSFDYNTGTWSKPWKL